MKNNKKKKDEPRAELTGIDLGSDKIEKMDIGNDKISARKVKKKPKDIDIGDDKRELIESR